MQKKALNHLEIRSPYSGEIAGTVRLASQEDVNRVVDTAAAYKSGLSRYELRQVLQQASQLLTARQEIAAALIVSESGLSYRDALYEVGRVCDVLQWSAIEATREDGQIFPCDVTAAGHQRKVISYRVPLDGVIVAITPFNHPMNQVAHKVGPAIATNNRIVVKPSEKVPLSALFLADLLYEAGLPREMFQVLTGEPHEIVTALLRHPSVELVAFTGGVEIGKMLASKIGYRRIVLELGGNDPLIVMEDADLERSAQLAVDGSYANSGQRCTAVKRVLVHAAVSRRFTEIVVEKTIRWSYGNPSDPAVQMGTVIDSRAAGHIKCRVDAAIANGARLLTGNHVDGALFAPTVLDQVTPDMELVQQETFGPVTPIMTFSSIDEAIGIANGTRFGLSAGVCTDRLDYVTRFAKELRVGTLNVWEVPGFRTELTPFGGTKDSGLGLKEGVLESARNYTVAKTLSLPWM